MAGFTEASNSCKYLVFILAINLFVHVISFGSPFWTTRIDGNAGLWTGCTGVVCYERWNQWVAGWIKTSQTCMTLSLITLSFTTLLVFLYVFHKSFDKDKRLIALSILLSVLSSLLTLIAVITWTAGEHLSSGETLNWPYTLAWLSAACSVVSIPFLWKEMKSENFYDSELQRKSREESAAAQRAKEMGYYFGPMITGPSGSQVPTTPSGTLNSTLNYSRDFN